MATTGHGGNPRCPNIFGRVKGSRRYMQPFGTSSSRAGDQKRPKPEVYSAAGDVSPQAGDREGPVSAHPLLGPRRWSPGRAGPKAEGTYPVSCCLGGWSAAWVWGYRGGGARGGLNGECWGPSPRAPRWVPDVRKTPREERATSKDRWWRPLLGCHSRAELPGAGERGDKGSLWGMRGGERFYSQGRHPSRVFPYKEESGAYSSGWCPRAPCRYLIGPGCRGSVPEV